MRPLGWDHPDTARYYEAFCEKHTRYGDAGGVLVEQASIEPGHRVLEVGAGTGRTAERVVPLLGAAGRLVCYEPAEAMRSCGMSRLPHPRVEWVSELPEEPARFDRVLCSAAVWQMQPFASAFRRFAGLLVQGGLFCCNIPSLYLGKADEPGGGADPYLHQLAAALAGDRTPSAPPCEPITEREIGDVMESAGLSSTAWKWRFRLTQDCLRDWLKIPVLTDALLPDLDADERAQRVDLAFATVDPDSWRWEEWTGFTGRKR